MEESGINEKMLKQIEKKWGKIPPTVKVLNAANPKAMRRYLGLRSELIKGGNLPLKTKRLILVAAAAAAKCQHCVEMHALEAVREGIPEQEIIEAISLAYLVGGAPALVAGAKALEVFEREIVY
mgnify:CR=1 FL=1